MKSRLVGRDKEYIIQTSNDADQSAVSSVLIVDGVPTETARFDHPGDIGSEEVLQLVRSKHDRTKQEVESLLNACREALDRREPEHMTNLGLACFYKGFYLEAQELMRTAIAVDGAGHRALHYLSQVESALERPAAAVQAAEQAVQLRPRFADYRNNLGVALAGAGRYRHAIGEFTEAIQINLYYAEAYFNLGLALVHNALTRDDPSLFEGVLSRSEEQFNRALMINSDYDTPLFHRGIQSLRETDLPGAYACFSRLREERWERHRREYASFYMQSILYPDWSNEDALDDRISFLQKEIERNPTYVDLVAQLGHCHLHRARLAWSCGLEQYRSALQTNASLKELRDILDRGEECLAGLDKVLSEIPKKG
ncbi:MAG: hypothetical protein ABIE70_06620 [bacterium]